MTPNKGSGPQFWDTVYISEVNGAKKVTPDALVAMNKNDVVVNFKKTTRSDISSPDEFLVKYRNDATEINMLWLVCTGRRAFSFVETILVSSST